MRFEAARADAALAVTNLVYLPLAYLGGLFQGTADLPSAVERWGSWVPTRSWNDAVQDATFGSPRIGSWLALGAWTVGFFVVAWLGFRRDEGRNYR